MQPPPAGLTIMGMGLVELLVVAGCVGIPIIVGVVAVVALLAKGSKSKDGH